MKTIKETININYLSERLGFANTPAYLYKHFKQDTSIYDLSKLYSTTELMSFLKDSFNSSNSLENLTVLYAIIIALTYKQEEEVKPIFEALKSSSIRWADKISDIYFSNNSVKNFELNFDMTDQFSQYTNVEITEPTFFEIS
jgi:hypothetical protein